ncbi:MAG: MFS transporter [Acidobacteriota bacterium]
MTETRRLGTFESLWRAFASWRTASVALLSFSSGLPLGLVWIAIPDWLRDSGVDIRTVGIITLAQAPWTFKFLWSPWMDRFAPPALERFNLGRRRGWALVAQVALFAFTLGLAGVADHPDAAWVVGALALAIAFASASQDIAIDAYAVDVLRKEEQGVAVGARVALYRAAMQVAGSFAITFAGMLGWAWVVIGLALLYVPMMLITWKAPPPEVPARPPKSLRDAVWLPFVGFLSRHRALEILAFVLCYKLADNLADALKRPFLVDMGYTNFDRGIALGTVGLVAVLAGTFLGGALTTVIGLGHSLWIFGALQIFSNIGYVLVAAEGDVNRPLMYAAITFEVLTQGLGTGAFATLLLRMTQKRFSATQYALFSSLFGLPRIISGPIAGFAVHAVGWKTFFWLTLPAGIPGMILLARFVPLGTREPVFRVETDRSKEPLSRGALLARGILGALGGLVFGVLTLAFLAALSEFETAGFDFSTPLLAILQPEGIRAILRLVGLFAFGAVCGLFTAAVFAARRGNLDLGEDEEAEVQPR